VLLLACDRQQASIIFRYISAYFEHVEMLRDLVIGASNDTIELSNQVDITVATSSYRSLRGRTVALAILDEVCFFRDESGNYQNPDTEIYNALSPGTMTMRKAGGGMIVGISTVYRKSGLLYSKWRQYHGDSDSDILVIRAPSITFNPTLDQHAIDADIALDPARGEAEWLSIWRSDIADFVDRQVVESLIVRGRYELLPLRGESYRAFTDVSGGSSDSFVTAIAHKDEHTGLAILDAIRETRPPFSPEAATAEHAAFVKSYGVATITGDKYGAQWPVDAFRRHGVLYEISERPKTEIYVEILPQLNARMVELLDNPRLVSQLCNLERRTVRGTGREIVDHRAGAGHHDDLANACSGALLLCAKPSALDIWKKIGREFMPQAVGAA